MPGPDVVLSVPVALGGDSLGGNGAAIAALGLVSMVAGYLLLAGLWYFVFRRSPEELESDRRAQEAREEALRQWRPATAAHESKPTAAEPTAASVHGHGEPLRIERTLGSRFRRR